MGSVCGEILQKLLMEICDYRWSTALLPKHVWQAIIDIQPLVWKEHNLASTYWESVCQIALLLWSTLVWIYRGGDDGPDWKTVWKGRNHWGFKEEIRPPQVTDGLSQTLENPAKHLPPDLPICGKNDRQWGQIQRQILRNFDEPFVHCTADNRL